MKFLRLIDLIAVLAPVMLPAVLTSAQSDLGARANQPTVSLPTQGSSAGSTVRLDPPEQKAQLHFAPAVAYDSGASEADSVALADLNGDGKLDAVVANWCQSAGQFSCEGYGEVAVLIGNGDGTFQSPVRYSTGAYFANSVAVGDVNGDGTPDLVVANYCLSIQPSCGGDGAISVLLGNGDGTFQTAATYNSGGSYAYSVAVADVNGDGILDLAVSNTGPVGANNGSVGVLLGNGDGTFRTAASYSSGGDIAASVAIGDVNGDGIRDLVVANYGGADGCGDCGAGVLLGNGDGTFRPAAIYNSGGGSTYSVSAWDLRGDGILDLVAASRSSDDEGNRLRAGVGVLLGNGDGTFQPTASYLAVGLQYISYPAVGWGIDSLAVADINGDGVPDLVIVEQCRSLEHYTNCVGTGQVNVMLGNGDGTFQAPITYGSGGYEGSSIAIGDVNGDGRPDLVLTNACGSTCSGPDGSVAVLLNTTSYATKSALTTSPNPSQVNQMVTLTATMASTPSIPNGEAVTFYNGSTNLGTGKTTNGVATLTTSFSKAKTYTIKADYPDDAFHKKSSGTVKQVVNP